MNSVVLNVSFASLIHAARCSEMKRDEAAITFCCLTQHIHVTLADTVTLSTSQLERRESYGANACHSVRGQYLYGYKPQSNYITPGTAIATVPTAGICQGTAEAA